MSLLILTFNGILLSGLRGVTRQYEKKKEKPTDWLIDGWVKTIILHVLPPATCYVLYNFKKYRIMYLLPTTYTKSISNREKGSCSMETCSCSLYLPLWQNPDGWCSLVLKNVIYGTQIFEWSIFYIEHILYKYPIPEKF